MKSITAIKEEFKNLTPEEISAQSQSLQMMSGDIEESVKLI
mgnify:CR=1 FL=1